MTCGCYEEAVVLHCFSKTKIKLKTLLHSVALSILSDQNKMILNFFKHFTFSLLLSMVNTSLFSVSAKSSLPFGMSPSLIQCDSHGNYETQPVWDHGHSPFSTGTGLIQGQVIQERQESFCRIWLVAPRKGGICLLFGSWILRLCTFGWHWPLSRYRERARLKMKPGNTVKQGGQRAPITESGTLHPAMPHVWR